jgi:hypothetical protein
VACVLATHGGLYFKAWNLSGSEWETTTTANAISVLKLRRQRPPTLRPIPVSRRFATAYDLDGAPRNPPAENLGRKLYSGSRSGRFNPLLLYHRDLAKFFCSGENTPASACPSHLLPRRLCSSLWFVCSVRHACARLKWGRGVLLNFVDEEFSLIFFR